MAVTRKTIGNIFNLVLVLLFVTSCEIPLLQSNLSQDSELNNRLVDNSFLDENPCQAPCWYDLELGKSTESEVRLTLRNLSFIDASNIEEHSSSYWDSTENMNVQAKLIAARCVNPTNQICASMIIAGGNLKSIILFPNQNISVSQVVDHLGDPDYFQLLPSFTMGCSVRLVWKQKQIIISLSSKMASSLCGELRDGKSIDPTLRINSIEYVIPDDIQLTSIPEDGRDYQWPGFSNP
jgi:hypothetical protein